MLYLIYNQLGGVRMITIGSIFSGFVVVLVLLTIIVSSIYSLVDLFKK
ncbi:hypothetical protein [Staphylococcus phage vB_SurM-PSU4]|nr:hypothetical protein [Staphylococcus phage vB_SurM-PSU4]